MQLTQAGDVFVLRMNAGKANAMSAEMLGALNGLLDQLEKRPAGAVLLTGYEGFFCAGLALPGLIDLARPQMKAFITMFGDTMTRVFELERPVVAAVNGHAIAGGCVLALQADLRLMAAGKAKIGLNEVVLGIGLPSIVLETLRCQVPVTSLLPIAMEGRIFTGEEARRLELVHELVAPEELEARAMARAQELGAIPAPAFAQVKAALRRPVMAEVNRHREAETDRWLDTWYSDAAQTRLRAAVARIAK